MSQILATNIRTLREARGQNQAEFADDLGVSQGMVSRWETGSEPKHEPLVRLAKMAGVTVGQLTSSLITDVKERAGTRVSEESAGRSILLPVALPSEDALTVMFEALLEVLETESDSAVAARRLAQLLPGALAQTVSRSLNSQQPGLAAPTRAEGAQARAKATPSKRQ
jgi:transcriptional regulator with XRE-family HTH domain